VSALADACALVVAEIASAKTLRTIKSGARRHACRRGRVMLVTV
jgi:hypothetical protein